MTLLNSKKHLNLFYKHGHNSFLTKKTEGDCETFYMHTLRFYLAPIVDDTWQRFQLGIVLLTMQGVERRNKESKNIFTCHTNKKGNQVKQCMYRLWDRFILVKS